MIRTGLLISVLTFLFNFTAIGQITRTLSTAARCDYLSEEEKQMVYEINLVRNHPQEYLDILKPYLKRAEAELEIYGPGKVMYSVETTYVQHNGHLSVQSKDSVAYHRYEEEVNAIRSLMNDLRNMQPLPALQPNYGLYKAAEKHGRDQDLHNWKLGHFGSDGSSPMERIARFSPEMVTGNENIASRYPEATPREMVILLLIDSGISGYGHRYNLLNPQWTHVACYAGGLHNGRYRWLQEFGESR